MRLDFATYAEGRSRKRRGLEVRRAAPPLDHANEPLSTDVDPTLDDRLVGRARGHGDGMTTLSPTDEARYLRADDHLLLALVASDTGDLAAVMARVIDTDQRASASARAALGGDGMADAWEQGRRLPLLEAIDVARAFLAGAMARHGESRTAETTSRNPCLHGLTRRELDVLREVAAGRSNREIAEALFISVPTTKRHLTNILGKLGLPSRSALNTYAHAHGIRPRQVERTVLPTSGGS